MAPITDFFRELDRSWNLPDPPVALHVIGSAALMLQCSYERGTKDGDVLETTQMSSEVRAHLKTLAGERSELHMRRRMFVDLPNGLPFLPSQPRWHRIAELNDLVHLQISALDVVDVIVSKLKRFGANDQADISAMIDGGRIAHARLLERFRSAFLEFTHDARAADLSRYVANLNQVERDLLYVSETDFSFELEQLRF